MTIDKDNQFEVILPACGKGKRFGEAVPKQYAKVSGAPVIVHTLRRFHTIPGISGIIIVCDPGFRDYVQKLVDQYRIHGVKHIVAGGERRQDSVYNALHLLEAKKTVVIHDAVRPCVKRDIILKGIEYAREFGAACASRPATQTMAMVEDGFIQEKLDRRKCWILQTPQVFRYDVLVSSYNKAHKDHFAATDDTQIVMTYSDIKVKLYWSNEENLKITYKGDLEIVESFLKRNYDQ